MENKTEEKIKSIKPIKIIAKCKGYKNMPWELFNSENAGFFSESISPHYRTTSKFLSHSAKLFAFSNTIRGKLSKDSQNEKISDEVDFLSMLSFPEFELIPFSSRNENNRHNDFILDSTSKDEFIEVTTTGTLTEYNDYYIISYDDHTKYDSYVYGYFSKAVRILIFKNNPDIVMISNNDFISEYLTFEKNRMTIDVHSNDIYYDEDNFEDGEEYFFDEEDINSDFLTINTHNISSEINEANGDLKLKYTIGMFGRSLGFTEYYLNYKVLEC